VDDSPSFLQRIADALCDDLYLTQVRRRPPDRDPHPENRDRAQRTLRDHGIGVAEDQQGRISERFEQAASSENDSGFGVGLWIVKQIADALGATVRVERRPGDGANFTLDLRKPAGWRRDARLRSRAARAGAARSCAG
jgi:hypothetical protein